MALGTRNRAIAGFELNTANDVLNVKEMRTEMSDVLEWVRTCCSVKVLIYTGDFQVEQAEATWRLFFTDLTKCNLCSACFVESSRWLFSVVGHTSDKANCGRKLLTSSRLQIHQRWLWRKQTKATPLSLNKSATLEVMSNSWSSSFARWKNKSLYLGHTHGTVCCWGWQQQCTQIHQCMYFAAQTEYYMQSKQKNRWGFTTQQRNQQSRCFITCNIHFVQFRQWFPSKTNNRAMRGPV